MRRIVLASRSSARERLLRQTGIRFKVIPSRIPEIETMFLASDKQIKSLALAKAESRIKDQEWHSHRRRHSHYPSKKGNW